MKDQLFLYGFQPRIIKPFSHSRCQRDAVMAAAEELGLSKECKAFYKQQGYQWYHLLPDFMLKNPGYLLQKAFWVNTFFVKTYQSKIDFSINQTMPVMIFTNLKKEIIPSAI